MHLCHKTRKPARPKKIPGKLILGIENGELVVQVVTDSDKEEAELLAAIRDRIIVGDLWELTEQ